MVDAAVEYVLEKIDNFVCKEVSLRGRNEEEIELLRVVRESITGALESVDGQNQVWIKQLRDRKYEIENVLIMYAYRDAEEHAKPWYRRGTLVLRDHSIANEMRRIQAKLRGIKDNNTWLGSHHAASSSSTELEAGTQYTPETEIIGVEEPRKVLASWVLDVDLAYRAMFVVGMGGSGKTALVKLVYDQVKADFYCHVWLTASLYEDMKHLLSDLCTKLCIQTSGSGQYSSSSLDDLIEMLRNYLQDKRYLIVLDDWKRKDWESIIDHAFPRDNNTSGSSRVMITTRRENLASSISCTPPYSNFVDIYKIPPLPCEKARQLFCRKAFSESGGAYPPVPGLPEASEGLLRECEGLPLGIVEMGKVLSRKKVSKSRIEDLENNLRAELKLESGQLSRITRVLISSYNELPYHLKCCFLYMIMFSKERPVKRGMLIRLWMAEDFIQRVDGGKEAEDIGEDYLEELTGRNLIIQDHEMVFDGAYRVHSLMHKIALSIAEDQSFCTIGVDIQENHQKLQRLSIQNSELKGLITKKVDLQHLHTLFVSSSSPQGKSHIPTIPAGIIPTTTYLNILHLDNTKVDALPKGVKELLLLKYLSLCNTDIKQIPISTNRLKFLETLNLKQTFVTVIPDSLDSLYKLRYLVAYRIDPRDPLHEVRGFKAPEGIRKLTSLQKLSHVIADRDHILIQELQHLTKLRKLGIVNLPSDSGPLLCQTLQKLEKLHSLSIAAERWWDQVPDIFQDINHNHHLPLPPLRRLYLWGRLQKMPRWISSLHELVRIRLKWSRLGAGSSSNNPITILGKLPNLVELQLVDAYTGNQLEFCRGTFLKLKILEVDRMEELQMIIIEDGALPCLKKLTISLCEKLGEILAGVDGLGAQLKELHLREMPQNFVNLLKRNGTLHHLVSQSRVNITSLQYQDGQWVHQDMS